MCTWSGIELITPWWRGTNGDHLYWYCPERWSEVARDRAAGIEPAPPYSVHGLNPRAADVCQPCVTRYNRTRPLTESDGEYDVMTVWVGDSRYASHIVPAEVATAPA